MRSVWICLAALWFIPTAASAKTVTVPVSESAVIANDSGDTRVLLRFPLETDRGRKISVARAVLRIPASPSDTRGRHTVCAFPITSPWNAGSVDWDGWLREGGDFDRSRGSWVTTDLNSTEIVLDVTVAVASAMRFDEAFEGLLLCPLEGARDGFGSGDLTGLHLRGATVEVTMREVGGRQARFTRE